jgi:hypothetical protein
MFLPLSFFVDRFILVFKLTKSKVNTTKGKFTNALIFRDNNVGVAY